MSIVLVIAIVGSLMAISIAKASQISQSSLSSSKISNQASIYALGEAEVLKSIDYTDLVSIAKSSISGTDYSKEILISAESDYSDTVKQKVATIKIYKDDERLPRAELNVNRFSIEKKPSSGVPIGTVIAWPSTKNPAEGTWLDCNGQSCTKYPELVAILGKNIVPDYRNRFLECNEIPGTLIEAGLPNITGRLHSTDWGFSGFDVYNRGLQISKNSALGITGRGGISHNSNNNNWPGTIKGIDFDASRSSAIYGNSDTVQPPTVTVRYLIKAA